MHYNNFWECNLLKKTEKAKIKYYNNNQNNPTSGFIFLKECVISFVNVISFLLMLEYNVSRKPVSSLF